MGSDIWIWEYIIINIIITLSLVIPTLRIIRLCFQIVKRGALAIVIGVTKPHVNEICAISPKTVHIHPNFDNFMQFMWFFEFFWHFHPWETYKITGKQINHSKLQFRDRSPCFKIIGEEALYSMCIVSWLVFQANWCNEAYLLDFWIHFIIFYMERVDMFAKQSGDFESMQSNLLSVGKKYEGWSSTLAYLA